MSANSLPLAPATIKLWLIKATAKLKSSDIQSARLDALLILEYVLNKDRSQIIAHDDLPLSNEQLEQLNTALDQRAQHVPIAYIRGFVEFYGRYFDVSPQVLIPRPETEELIELALALPLGQNTVVIDVGTGSGCIPTSLRLERPQWRVYGTDISPSALTIAQANALKQNATVTLAEANLLQEKTSRLLPASASLITANLPYVAESYAISPDAKHEPGIALFAKDEGYELIEKLLPQAQHILTGKGYLLLESDPWQQARIIKVAAELGFHLTQQRRFHIVLQKR